MRAIADDIAVMYRGKVVRYGPKAEVLSPPFDDYTEMLLDSVSEMRLSWLEQVMSGRSTDGAGDRRGATEPAPMGQMPLFYVLGRLPQAERETCTLSRKD